MNLETLDLLTLKIEKALATIRTLRSENLRYQEHSLGLDNQLRLVEGQLATTRSEQERLQAELDVKQDEAQNLAQELSRKDQEIASVRGEVEQRVVELNRLQDSLREKEDKIQAAAGRLEEVMASLELELNVQVGSTDEDEFSDSQPFQEDKAFGSPADMFGFHQN